MPAPHLPINPSFPDAPTGPDRHDFNIRVTPWVGGWIQSVAKSYSVSQTQVVLWVLEFGGITTRPESDTAPPKLPLPCPLTISLPTYLATRIMQVCHSTGRTRAEVLRASLNLCLPQSHIWGQVPLKPPAPKLSRRYNSKRMSEAAEHIRAVHGVKTHKPPEKRMVTCALTPKLLARMEAAAAERGLSRTAWAREALLKYAARVDARLVAASAEAQGDTKMPVRLDPATWGLLAGQSATLNTRPTVVARAALLRALIDNE